MFLTTSPSTKNKTRSRPEKQVEGDLAAMFVTISPSTKQFRSRPEKQIKEDLAKSFVTTTSSPEREREREREREIENCLGGAAFVVLPCKGSMEFQP